MAKFNKNLLNSLYGMMSQDPAKQTIDFIAEAPEQIVEREDDIADLAELSQWGIWITARARLQEGLDLAGHNAVYCDTDSVKYLGAVDMKHRLTE